MSTFTCRITVSSADLHEQRDLKATVNIDNAFSMLPARLLRDLGIVPSRQAHYTMPDGRRDLMDIGDVHLTVEGSSGMTPVVFGPDDAGPLVGRVALASLGLKADPTTERLFPTHGFLPSMRPNIPRSG